MKISKNIKNNLVMQAPDAWPGKDEVKHDCFQPQLQGYDGEYGRPHEAECQKCISVAYSIERLNEFGYKVSLKTYSGLIGLRVSGIEIEGEMEHKNYMFTEWRHVTYDYFLKHKMEVPS